MKSKQISREEIEAATKDFVARGGKIKKITVKEMKNNNVIQVSGDLETFLETFESEQEESFTFEEQKTPSRVRKVRFRVSEDNSKDIP